VREVTAEEICADEAATRRAGAKLAGRLAPGDLVLLSGELGVGKTVFVRGLAEGLGADPDDVSSPTFALVHEYGPAGKPPLLLHADFYRLGPEGRGPGVAELGLNERGDAVVAIEWPRPPYTAFRAFRVTIEELEGGARRVTVEPPVPEADGASGVTARAARRGFRSGRAEPTSRRGRASGRS
jgi:tRNA threonylcarbamoyladenosine biosynthesis protein TsaE